MINVVLCGYRDWANFVFDEISNHSQINVLHRISSQKEYLIQKEYFSENIDIILFIGWSWIIAPEITNKYLCLGVHPSDLPYYRGGSPIQNQIINGIKRSKVTLMTLSDDKLDAGDIWLKEDLDLGGNSVEVIFRNISHSTIRLLNDFFDKFPNIQPIFQDTSKGSYFKRRKPEQSKISKDVWNNMTLIEIYNFIRCLTDPYPNAHIEDEDGNRLIFKAVEYIPKN